MDGKINGKMLLSIRFVLDVLGKSLVPSGYLT